MAWFEEFVVGWEVITHLTHAHLHAEPLPHKSYFLGWWWEGENVLVPELVAEVETANQFEELFPDSTSAKYGVDFSKVRAGNSVKVKNLCNEITLPTPLTINSNTTSHLDAAMYCVGSKIILNQSGSNIGTWYLTPCFGIGLKTPPHPLRRLAGFLILGMTWEPKSTPQSPPPSIPTPLSILKSRLRPTYY